MSNLLRLLRLSFYVLLIWPTPFLSSHSADQSLPEPGSEQALIANLQSIAAALTPSIAPSPAVDASLENWNAFLQHNFLRPSTCDHQELYNSPPYTNYPQLIPFFTEIGLIQGTYPAKQDYSAIVIFGGTPWDTKERFSYLKKLIQAHKITPSRFIYINGHRSLKEIEKHWLLEHHYQEKNYQHEAAAEIWKKSFSHKLTSKDLEIMTIPALPTRRANTLDTVQAYFKTYDFESTLFITNGPYGPFQEEIVKGVKPSRISEVIQSPTRDTAAMTSLLDTIARRVYVMLENKTSSEAAKG